MLATPLGVFLDPVTRRFISAILLPLIQSGYVVPVSCTGWREQLHPHLPPAGVLLFCFHLFFRLLILPLLRFLRLNRGLLILRLAPRILRPAVLP